MEGLFWPCVAGPAAAGAAAVAAPPPWRSTRGTAPRGCCIVASRAPAHAPRPPTLKRYDGFNMNGPRPDQIPRDEDIPGADSFQEL
jgi:hypothetical protein